MDTTNENGVFDVVNTLLWHSSHDNKNTLFMSLCMFSISSLHLKKLLLVEILLPLVVVLETAPSQPRPVLLVIFGVFNLFFLKINLIALNK